MINSLKGVRINSMYCNNCGKHNPEDSKFCKSCGEKLVKISEQEADLKQGVTKEELTPSTDKKKNNYSHWLLWWMVDKDEITRQVHGYNTLDIWHASRKIAALALLFSSALTVILVLFANWDSSSLIDVLLMLVIAFFIYKGHRWAMVVAMIYWTYAKLYGLFTSYSSGSTPSPIVAIIWWAIFMHAFFEAYKVEQARRKK